MSAVAEAYILTTIHPCLTIRNGEHERFGFAHSDRETLRIFIDGLLDNAGPIVNFASDLYVAQFAMATLPTFQFKVLGIHVFGAPANPPTKTLAATKAVVENFILTSSFFEIFSSDQ